MEIHVSEIPKQCEVISSQEFNVLAINSISAKHKELRSKSKAPTFALT